MSLVSSPFIFGRYVSGASVVHALDARCKLTLLLLFMVAGIVTTTPVGLVLCASFTLAAYACARIPARVAAASVAPLLIIVIFTALANLFFVQGGATLWSAGPLSITEHGAYQAFFMSVRLIILLFGACLVTMTTTSLDITDALERMLWPFARFGLPAHELAMIAGIALRFLPQFALEFQSTRAAHISRGASFTKGSLRERAHAISALFVPLFTSAFRHADTLASGMDARCYHGAMGRTHLHESAFHARDAVACTLTALLLAAVIACRILGW